MKTFSLGFILASIRIAYLHNWHLNSIKVFFDNIIVILPSLVVLAFFTWLVITTIGNRFIHFTIYSVKKVFAFCKYVKDKLFSKTNGEQNKTKELNWQCLLIDGVWGSGKTTHYKKYYQYIDAKPNIYISCFSASRSELIAQIIQQQFLCKLLTLNGLLAKLMESNWQIFMPKGRVIVFDDLERLHANQDNYLDLIGIIDYLKDKMECKIILICNMSELKELEIQKQHIFNTYMERIVDDVEWIPKLPNLSELFKHPKDKHHYKHVDLNSPIIQKIIIDSKKLYDENKLKNLRIFKTSISNFANKFNIHYPDSRNWDEKKQIIYAETYANEIYKNMLIRYLFFADYQLFNDIRAFIINQGVQNKAESDAQKLSSNELQQRLESRLEKYGTELKFNDFQYDENKTSPLPMITFNEEKCVVFALENMHILAKLEPKYIKAIQMNLHTLIYCLTFKQAKMFIQHGAYKDQYNGLPLQEWKKYIAQYVDSFQNRFNLFSSFGMANRHNYIEGFALAILLSKLSLTNHFDKTIDSIVMNLKLGKIPFNKVVSSRKLFWEENGIQFDQLEKYKYTENNPNENGISFKMHVMACLLEKYIYWFIDDDFRCSKILKELNLNYKKVLNIVEERRTTG